MKDGILITLALAARLEGRVVMRGTETPIAGARVTIKGEGPAFDAFAIDFEEDAMTDAAGFFTIDGLPAGRAACDRASTWCRCKATSIWTRSAWC